LLCLERYPAGILVLNSYDPIVVKFTIPQLCWGERKKERRKKKHGEMCKSLVLIEEGIWIERIVS